MNKNSTEEVFKYAYPQDKSNEIEEWHPKLREHQNPLHTRVLICLLHTSCGSTFCAKTIAKGEDSHVICDFDISMSAQRRKIEYRTDPYDSHESALHRAQHLINGPGSADNRNGCKIDYRTINTAHSIIFERERTDLPSESARRGGCCTKSAQSSRPSPSCPRMHAGGDRRGSVQEAQTHKSRKCPS